MKTEYNNRMGSPSHIREVGPHAHEWSYVGTDVRGDAYHTCRTCGTRRNVPVTAGLAPLRQNWLNGGSWEEGEEVGEEEVGEEEKVSKPRRRLSAS